MYSVYRLNFPNGKYYIGQTKKKVSQRFVEHCWDRTGSKNNLHRPIIFAMKKYKGMVTFEILETSLSLDEANYLEKYYIKSYNTTNINYGYNLSPGGQSGSIISESGKKRRIEKMTKYYNDPNWVENITKHLNSPINKEKAKNGHKEFIKNNPNFYSFVNKGRKHSRDQKLNKSRNMGGRDFYCVETGQRFQLLEDAALVFGVDKRRIFAVLSYPNRYKTILRKYTFRYVEEV